MAKHSLLHVQDQQNPEIVTLCLAARSDATEEDCEPLLLLSLPPRFILELQQGPSAASFVVFFDGEHEFFIKAPALVAVLGNRFVGVRLIKVAGKHCGRLLPLPAPVKDTEGEKKTRNNKLTDGWCRERRVCDPTSSERNEESEPVNGF